MVTYEQLKSACIMQARVRGRLKPYEEGMVMPYEETIRDMACWGFIEYNEAMELLDILQGKVSNGNQTATARDS